ncbi:MAG: hypothetical protein RID91_07645 [Azospirillaceae bacterium]
MSTDRPTREQWAELLEEHLRDKLDPVYRQWGIDPNSEAFQEGVRISREVRQGGSALDNRDDRGTASRGSVGDPRHRPGTRP